MAKQRSTSQAEQDEANDDQDMRLDPVIEAMLEHLPAPGEHFPNRTLWLQIWELILKLVYPEEEAQEPGGGQPT